MKEVWKDIQGWEGIYQVSNLGRVRSLSRELVQASKLGKKFKYTRPGRVLKSTPDRGGYRRVCFKHYDLQKSFFIHRLVAIAFIPNPESKIEINHIDCDKNNNQISNLEWVTKLENVIHASKNNLWDPPKGENHYKSKLNKYQVQRIKLMKEIDPKISLKKISDLLNVSASSLTSIYYNKSWKHI